MASSNSQDDRLLSCLLIDDLELLLSSIFSNKRIAPLQSPAWYDQPKSKSLLDIRPPRLPPSRNPHINALYALDYGSGALVAADAELASVASSAVKPFASPAALERYLKSQKNAAVAPPAVDPHHPLCHYYILLSHNTYLTGRQVAGTSSTALYKAALRRGCRSVEIDVWDGVAGPVVSHGPTLTAPVALDAVVATVRRYAFEALHMPLVLLVEVHCRRRWQPQVVELFVRGFGPLLATAEPGIGTAELLRDKILVKIKRASSTDFTALDLAWLSGSSSHSSSHSSALSGREVRRSITRRLVRNPHPSPPCHKIIPELCELSTHVWGVKFLGFSTAPARAANHCFLFSNSKLRGMLRKGHRNDVLRHNCSHMMRVYPLGYRITSDNFNPVPFWKHGCQMVATNWQTFDEGEQLNEAMFADAEGLVLKPHYLRDPASAPPEAYMCDISFRIEILSMEGEIKDAPSVAIKILGNDGPIKGNSNTKHKSLFKVEGGEIEDEGLVVWENTNCFTGTIKNSLKEFIFVRVLVDGGQRTFTARLEYLQKGYKYWSLRDSKGRQTDDLLFVKLHWEIQ